MWEAKGRATGNMLVSIEVVLSLCIPFFPQVTYPRVYASLKSGLSWLETPEDLDKEAFYPA